MGAFLVNVHVQTEDQASLVHALHDMSIARSWVTPASEGWSTLYEERASTQDDEWIRELSRSLSTRLETRAVAFLVHDSDFFCYWLFDRGELVDEFNSCPDYFDDGAAGEGSAGQPEVLLRFCRPGHRVEEIERILHQETTFAETQLEELAPLLGIGVERVLVDFGDFDAGGETEGLDAVFVGTAPQPAARASRRTILRFPAGDVTADDEAEDDDDKGPSPTSGAFGHRFAELLGLSRAAAPADPLVQELVQAAFEGKVAEIDRLFAAGADVNGMSTLKLPREQAASLVARMLQGGALAVPVSPLLTAVAGKHIEAVRRLIELGADVNAGHAIFGTSVHAAASGGAPQMLELLLDAGGRVNEPNAQGQTPLVALRAFRAMSGQLDHLRAMKGALPAGFLEQFERMLPTAGWDECERLLLEHGAK